MNMIKSRFLQKTLAVSSVCVMAFLMILAPVNSVYAAMSETQLYENAQNGVYFYKADDCGSGGSSGGNREVTVLPGNNVKEKIWNWFASAGIESVSDNANVIAGIMGNLQAESSFRPFAKNSGGCVGLYQACGSRATRLKDAFRNAGIDESYWQSPDSATDEVIDTAIDVTLELMTVGADSNNFRPFVNYISKASEDTPQAYSDLFLAINERAYSSEGKGDAILEPAAREYVLNDGIDYTNPDYYQAAGLRRNYSIDIYNNLSGHTITGEAVTRVQSDTRSVVCSDSGYMGSGELIAGGMTLAEAKAFMEPYRSITPRNYEDSGGSILGKWHINNLKLHSDGGSCLSDLENCVAFTQYFICEYAHVCRGLGNGGGVAAELVNSGSGFTGGTQPQPYAVFSNRHKTANCTDNSCGHTGIVLGVDTERNKIVVGEAGCGNAIDWTTAHEYDLSRFTSGYEYAYTNGLIGL